MRDIDRIDGFVAKLEEYWKTYVPDWRFAQLICNLQSFAGNDLFYLEDEDFLNLLKRYFEGDK